MSVKFDSSDSNNEVNMKNIKHEKNDFFEFFPSEFDPFIGEKSGEIFISHDKIDGLCKYGIICHSCQEKFFEIDLFCEHVHESHLANDDSVDTSKLIEIDVIKEENIPNNQEFDYDEGSNSTSEDNDNDDDDDDDDDDKTIKNEDDLLSDFGLNIKTDPDDKLPKSRKEQQHYDRKKTMSLKDCHLCGKKFNRPSRLRKHLLTHDRKLNKIWKCQVCTQEFKEKKAYRNHREHAHNNLPCPICNKMFFTKKNLDVHISIHDENRERSFQCDQCDANYFTKHALNTHIKCIHLDIKNHCCKFCNKRFFKNSAKEVHERIHTGERPFICELCGSTFQTSALLNNHKKRHNNEKNYNCDVCNKKFFTHTYLRDHMITHTKEKPHKCDLCQARFTLKSGLNKHKQLHSDVKRYVCNICGKAYAQNPGLYAHMKSHKLANQGDSLIV